MPRGSAGFSGASFAFISACLQLPSTRRLSEPEPAATQEPGAHATDLHTTAQVRQEEEGVGSARAQEAPALPRGEAG